MNILGKEKKTMFNLKIKARKGKKNLSFGTFYEYCVEADNGYYFYILSKVEIPEVMQTMPCVTSAYKGKVSIKPDYDVLDTYGQII